MTYEIGRAARALALRDRPGYRCRRQRRERRRDIGNPLQPTLAQIADHERLLETLNVLRATSGTAPGPDGVTYDDIGRSEAAQIMRDLSRELLERTYAPSMARLAQIPKPNGRGHRVLRIRSIVNRVVAASLNEALTPVWEQIFLDRSCGFRPGRGTWDLLLDLEQTMFEEDRYVVAQDDVDHAFDNVNVGDAMGDHRRYIADPGVLWLVETLLRGHPSEQRTVGIDQGMAYSPTVLNARLHYVLDIPFSADSANPPWYRYADNVVYLGRSVSEGNQAVQTASQLLQAAGFSLKGEHQPVDLRENGASAELLGFRLSLRNKQVRYGLSGAAWDSLRDGLGGTWETTDPSSNVIQFIRGWISSWGPAFEKESEKPFVDRTLREAAEMGFREISRESIRQWMQRSRDRWREAKATRQRLREETVSMLAGPPAPADQTARFDGRDLLPPESETAPEVEVLFEIDDLQRLNRLDIERTDA